MVLPTPSDATRSNIYPTPSNVKFLQTKGRTKLIRSGSSKGWIPSVYFFLSMLLLSAKAFIHSPIIARCSLKHWQNKSSKIGGWYPTRPCSINVHSMSSVFALSGIPFSDSYRLFVVVLFTMLTILIMCSGRTKTRSSHLHPASSNHNDLDRSPYSADVLQTFCNSIRISHARYMFLRT